MKIDIVDVSARDGLQNEPQAVRLSAQDKVDYIKLLMATGLKRIEAGSFVKPSAVPAMANSAQVGEDLKPLQAAYPQVTFSYLVPNERGLERARAIKAKEIAIFLGVSEEFARDNINAPSVEQSFADIAPVVGQALAAGIRVRGYLSTIFGYSDMAFSPDKVAQRAAQLLAMGCYEVSLGDTTGIGTADMTATLITALRDFGVPLSKVAMHFHDTFGRAIQNVAVSYEMGIRIFDASTGGLGGCPYAHSAKGNLAMGDLIHWARVNGIATPVTNPDMLEKAARFMLQKLGKTA